MPIMRRTIAQTAIQGILMLFFLVGIFAISATNVTHIMWKALTLTYGTTSQGLHVEVDVFIGVWKHYSRCFRCLSMLTINLAKQSKNTAFPSITRALLSSNIYINSVIHRSVSLTSCKRRSMGTPRIEGSGQEIRVMI